ncbi:MAG: hypothetical protein XD91_0351 [Clostridiales bacterium 38_11]|nr:MAG: hypothetical protein XD91_0351 [Clostridiales bacterium 38_11]HBH12734.1 hypothetical protein [Clostridiales bacterium]
MRRMNIADFIIIIFIIGGILVLASKLGTFGLSLGQGEEIKMRKAVIVLEVEDVREATVNALKIGHIVLSEETNSPIGPIIEMTVTPYMDEIETVDGKIVFSEVPGKYTIIVSLEASLLERETGYFAEGITEMKVNSIFKFYTKYVSTSGRIEEIDLQ